MKKFHIRLTGLSTPLGGLSWQYRSSEAEIARNLVSFLEDRRVLNPRAGHAVCAPGEYAIKSVQQIRERLRVDIEKLAGNSKLAGSLRKMQSACRKFLTEMELDDLKKMEALDRLAIIFADEMLAIGSAYGFSLESDDDLGQDEKSWRDCFRSSYQAQNDNLRMVPNKGHTTKKSSH